MRDCQGRIFDCKMIGQSFTMPVNVPYGSLIVRVTYERHWRSPLPSLGSSPPSVKQDRDLSLERWFEYRLQRRKYARQCSK